MGCKLELPCFLYNCKNVIVYMAPPKKVLLKDIAGAVGVSTALVSFVLNGKGDEFRVGEDTARKIKEAAKKMNYRPNLAAKSLRSGKSKTIGLVVSDISNPFFAQLGRMLEDEAGKRGYTVLFGSSDEDATKMTHVVDSLVYRGVDGLIIVPCENSEEYVASLVENNFPVVLFDRYFPDIKVSYVALNNYEASYVATKYLLDAGYAMPVLVAYEINLIHMKERIRGYKQAMEDAGKKAAANVVFLRRDLPDKATNRLMVKALENGTDAFLFATNMISLSCLYALTETGITLPKKIGMVGFDGSPVFDFCSIPVSYIRQPMDILVQKALEILLDNIDNGNVVQSVLAEGTFVEAPRLAKKVASVKSAAGDK